MLRIAICDDDVIMTSEIERLLEQAGKKVPLDIEISVFFDGGTLVKSMEQGTRFDIYYLDIEMEKMNGIDTAKYIRIRDQQAVLIYVSGFEQYMMELFEVEPFRFLKKPVDEQLFEQYFLAGCQKATDQNLYFSYKFKKVGYRVPIKDIIYFESRGRTILILTRSAEEKFYGKLNDIEKHLEEMNSGFLRIHQSFLINYAFLKRITYADVTLSNGMHLHISEERQKMIREKYSQLMRRDIIG